MGHATQGFQRTLWEPPHLEINMIVAKIKTISHHRNGIGGDPFYCVAFVFQHEKKNWDMIATLDPENSSLTRVLCITNPEDGWRGDTMFDLIIDAVANAVKRGLIDETSLVWANAMLSYSDKRSNNNSEDLASDGYPMEKFDGLTPADHGTHTP